MRTPTKLLLTALATALVLASVVGTASARRIELSYQHILALWREMKFEGGGGANVLCAVTLESSFHSKTLSKVNGQLVGYITEVHVGHPCSTNEAWALNGTEVIGGVTVSNTLPWHLRFMSFTGTLPRITSITLLIVGAAFLVNIIGNQCLYKSTEASPATAIANVNAEGQVTEITAGGTIPLFVTLVGFCPANGILSGTSVRVGRQPEPRESEYRPITVRLVQ